MTAQSKLSSGKSLNHAVQHGGNIAPDKQPESVLAAVLRHRIKAGVSLSCIRTETGPLCGFGPPPSIPLTRESSSEQQTTLDFNGRIRNDNARTSFGRMGFKGFALEANHDWR